MNTRPQSSSFRKFSLRRNHVVAAVISTALVPALMGTCAADLQAGPIATVTTTADTGPGSFRQALTDAASTPGTNIRFNIPDTDPNFKNGVFTILPDTPLPAITAERTVIDGSTQTAFTGDTNKVAPEVVLMSDNLRSMRGHGLHIVTPNCMVKSLTINASKGNAFRAGIHINGPRATGNRVVGCMIGLDPLGTERMGHVVGVQIFNGASGNVIGGNTPEARNIISGNDAQIKIIRPGTQLNRIQGNYIGTTVDGEKGIEKDGQFTKDGIFILEGANSNLVGGDGPGEGNLICSTKGGGAVRIEGSDGNVIQGNLMGSNKTGTVVISSCGTGVRIMDKAKDNLVGGTTAGAGNLIVGATEMGIHLLDTTGNIIQRNYIGCDITGVKALGNHTGITIEASSNNLIGGTEMGCGNIISGNLNDGILFIGDELRGESSRNIIQGNYIGLGIDGKTAMGNGGVGIRITGIGNNNIAGLAEDGSGIPNIIAYNKGLPTLEQGPDPTKLTGNSFRGNSTYHNGDKT